MTARVTIYDDNGNPKGTYGLKPSRIYEGRVNTKYVFEFECIECKAESEKSDADSD